MPRSGLEGKVNRGDGQNLGRPTTSLHNTINQIKHLSLTNHLGGLAVVESIPAVEFRL
jgi:hypothetical protein